MTPTQILDSWRCQNPALVKALQKNRRLPARLKEAATMADLVLGDAMEKGLHVSQAIELALDAVALERAK